MSSLLRLLTYISLAVLVPGLMIVIHHPWMGAWTLAGVLAGSLIHSRIRTDAEIARERERLDHARYADYSSR